jgi:hypothetical protein
MGVEDLVALADVAHVGAAGLAVGYAIRFLIVQDARTRGDIHNDVLMKQTMYGRPSTPMITAASCRPVVSNTV